MKNLMMLMLIVLPLVGCSASIGTNPPATTSTTYTTPVEPVVTAPATTTVTETTYH